MSINSIFKLTHYTFPIKVIVQRPAARISESNQQNAEDMLQFVANSMIKNPQVGATQWIPYPAQLATDGIEKKFEFMIGQDDDDVLVMRYLEVHDLA